MASIEGGQVQRKRMTYGKPARKKLGSYMLDNLRKSPEDVFDSDSGSTLLPASSGRPQNVSYNGVTSKESRKSPSPRASVVRNRDYIQRVSPNPIKNSRHPKSQEQRSEEHTSELQSQSNLVCRLLLEK